MAMSKTARRRVIGAERKANAVELRKRGLSFQAIADRLGISRQGAHRTVTAALRDISEKAAESAAELVELEQVRLDAMLAALWPGIETGDPKAISTALRVSERRARLLGLDAPVPRAGDPDDSRPTIPLALLREACERAAERDPIPQGLDDEQDHPVDPGWRYVPPIPRPS